MSGVRDDFLSIARVAAGLLREPPVADAWAAPSALAEYTVGGLAGHLAYQILSVPGALSAPVPTEEVVPLLGHYERVTWMDAGLNDDINVTLRRGAGDLASDGPAALASRVDTALTGLTAALRTARNRQVRLPFWSAYSLRLDDFLTTRTMELAVHIDDLAVSAAVPTPDLPQGAVDTSVALLAMLSARRHGAAAVLRGLSRAERAPASIVAF